MHRVLTALGSASLAVRTLVGLAGVLVIFLCVGVASGAAGSSDLAASALQDTLRVGDDAPMFVMEDLATGEPVFLSDFTGATLRQPWKGSPRYVVVICFWASWSEPSREEITALTSLAEKFSEKAVKFFLANTQERAGATRQFVRTVVQQRAIALPVLLDVTGTVADRYGVQDLPVTAVADKQGVLRMLHRGPGSVAGGNLEALVLALADKP